MNNSRRKQIDVEIADIEKALAALNDALSNLENIRDDEQDYYDNMPEGLQGGEKGELAQENVTSLEEAIDAIQSLLDAEVVEALQAAQQ